MGDLLLHSHLNYRPTGPEQSVEVIPTACLLHGCGFAVAGKCLDIYVVEPLMILDCMYSCSNARNEVLEVGPKLREGWITCTTEVGGVNWNRRKG